MSYLDMPKTLGAKLQKLKETIEKSQQSFDNDEKVISRPLTDAEYDAFKLVHLLGPDFFRQISDIIDVLPPEVSVSRTSSEAKKFILNRKGL